MSSKSTESKPPNTLKSKVGSGGISPLRIERAEDLVQRSDIGFGSYVKEQLIVLDESIGALKAQSECSDAEQLTLIAPVMTLKAHGAMFGYQIISHVATDILNILEQASILNDDLYEILGAFKHVLHTIVDKNIKRDEDSPVLYALTQELALACQRYAEKY